MARIPLALPSRYPPGPIAQPRRRRWIWRLLRWAIILGIWSAIVAALALLWLARDIPRPETALDTARRPASAAHPGDAGCRRRGRVKLHPGEGQRPENPVAPERGRVERAAAEGYGYPRGPSARRLPGGSAGDGHAIAGIGPAVFGGVHHPPCHSQSDRPMGTDALVRPRR